MARARFRYSKIIWGIFLLLAATFVLVNQFAALAENAPQLSLTGNVSLGGIEIRYIQD
jgi:cell division septal protein FtsQ